MTCVKCRAQMRTLQVPVDTGNFWVGERFEVLELDVCEACGGAWFDGGEWNDYARRRFESAPEPSPLPAERREFLDQRVADCPRCHTFLAHKRVNGARADVCGRCWGVWLDGGEYPTDPRLGWAERVRRLLS